MLNITSLYVRSFDLDHLNIFWEIDDIATSDDIMGYDFYLYKSESPLGPFTQVTGPFTNQYFYQDSINRLQHKDRRVFYKLKIIDKRTSDEKEFGPSSQIPELDLLAMEIIRQEDIIFRQFIGRKCLLYPRKTTGAPCICINKTASRQMDSNCMTCYGTGTLGGYLSPIWTYIQIDPHPKSIQLTQNFEHSLNLTTGRLINYPPVKPKDIIIENENRRWIINSVRQTERLRAPIHQELEIMELLKSDMVYKLPVITDIKDVEDIAEQRNFTNPQTTRNDTNDSYENQPRGTTFILY